MKQIINLCFTALIFLLLCLKTAAQVKVGDNPGTIQNASLLELESTDKGLVMPRVSLTGAITSPLPLAADILPGTIVYNTNPVFIGGLGLQIWTGSTWMVVTPSSLSSTDAWKLTGNSGTDSFINFMGTTDAQPLIFKVNGQKAGRIDYSDMANISMGYQTLNSVTTGIGNAAFGYQALYSNTTGLANTAIGYNSLAYNTTGNYNTALGTGALVRNNSGIYNTATGVGTLFSNLTGNFNTGNGLNALYYNVLGNDNAAFGLRSLFYNTTGSLNVAYGDSTLLLNITGNNNTAIGHHADVTSSNLSNATAIGAKAKVDISNALVLGDSINNVKIGIGTGKPTANLHVKGSVRFGSLTNGVLTADVSGNLSTTTLAAITGNTWSLKGNSGTNPSANFIGTTDAQPLVFKVNGEKAGRLDYLGSAANTAFGFQSLNAVTSGNYNVATGYQALYFNTTGYGNVASGCLALYRNTFGTHNTADGYGAMNSNITGTYNTADGFAAMGSNQTGNYNTANGSNSLMNNVAGDSNTAIGTHALYNNITGSFNTAIGVNADVNSNNLTNATAIGYNAKVAISNALVLGNTTDNVKVGIGTPEPEAPLEIRKDAAGSLGPVLQLTNGGGNMGAAAALDFYTYKPAAMPVARIYATDVGNYSSDIVFSTKIPGNQANGLQERMHITSNGSVGFGTSTPGINAKVEIAGSISHTLSDYNYVSQYGTGHQASSSSSVSLYTSDAIWCGGFLAVTSDERTKTNIITSGSFNDLALINKLRVVNYNYKDKVSKGTANITGFLAQEVEQVMPDAITKNKGVVPDIYQNATVIKYDKLANTLTLTLKEAADAKAGDTIKLITDAGEQLAAVASVNNNNITVSNWTSNSSWVFVYGKQVNDLHNLDYNKIFSAGIGAIQELSKENEALKSDVETLKAQMKIIMGKVNATVQAN